MTFGIQMYLVLSDHLKRSNCLVILHYLTPVTLEVEVLLEGDHPDCLLAPRGGDDGLVTAHTQRGEAPATHTHRHTAVQPGADPPTSTLNPAERRGHLW